MRVRLLAVAAVMVTGVAALVTVAASSADAATPSFTDVPRSSQFYGDITWLVDEGITGGFPDGGYHPTAAVSRQSMAAFLFRLRNPGTSAPACDASRFTDVGASNPFCGDITWLVDEGITGGFPDGGYHPTAVVSRQSMAAFLHRLDNPAPGPSASHYVRTSDPAALAAAGAADARVDAAAKLSTRVHVLDVGAQTTKNLSGPGVLLTGTDIRLTDAELVTVVQQYVTGYASASGGASVTIAVATNNDGDFTTFTATEKGTDWATNVINPLRAAEPAGVTVVGGNDIEPGFASTATEAQQWENAYLAATGADLIFIGSADGCPTTYGATGGTCNHGWTQQQLYRLAGGNSSRVTALPQMYVPAQALQWANIDLGGGGGLDLLGSLTESGVPGSISQAPAAGWLDLWNALTAVGSPPNLPVAADLTITS